MAANKNTQTPDPVTTASAAPAITQNPAITNGSTSSTNPAATPKTPGTAAPTKDPIKKNPAQEQALKQMIEKLNADGATIPTDLNDKKLIFGLMKGNSREFRGVVVTFLVN